MAPDEGTAAALNGRGGGARIVVMQLPPVLKARFSAQVVAYEEERKMPYVTETIQLFREKGLQV